MEVPALYFFSFCTLIGVTFFHLGLNTLDKTGLSHSVSPVIMSLFKHAFAISICHSSSYALIFRPKQRIMVERRYFWLICGFTQALIFRLTPESSTVALWCFLACFLLGLTKFVAQKDIVFYPILALTSQVFPRYISIYGLVNFLISICVEYITTEEKIAVGAYMIVELSLFSFDSGKILFFPILVIYIAYYTSTSLAAMSGLEPYTYFLTHRNPDDDFFQKLQPLAARGKEILSKLGENKMGKLIEFVVAMMGTILFQSFFRITTFNQVVAFLFLAVAWLANLALMQVSWDFGVFNFLLSNVVVGCTVSQFGLRGTTWLAYGASVLLYGLRIKVESLCILDREGEGTRVVLW
ncbi:hypothetical protein F511_24887 [Dorcoceras hygrometricum]|uniref:Uncharacterized protein n=1 Tax=Dorcoceras hygrometricum TaxID=472368 RepID=A0A2Z7A3H0_9LAMI|nr:hypothetical protein F511_24887 [Dorcoceras hygrometricum]